MQTVLFFLAGNPQLALLRAKKKAQDTNDTVRLNLNGVNMIITKDTDIKKSLVEYQEQLNLRYKNARLKVIKQNGK